MVACHAEHQHRVTLAIGLETMQSVWQSLDRRSGRAMQALSPARLRSQNESTERPYRNQKIAWLIGGSIERRTLTRSSNEQLNRKPR
jgi:hypothetical protein